MKLDKDNTGVLFPNHKKTTEKHPNLTGMAKIDGLDYWASGWVNTDKNQQKYISMTFKLKESNASSVQKKIEDDIPF